MLGKNGTISAEDTQSLAEVCARGMPVSLSTGRTTPAALRIINQLSLDGYHIFFDGALASDPKKNEEVYAQPISKGMVKQAIEFAHQNGVDIEFYSATHYFAERETWSTEIRRQFFGIEPTILDFNELWERERIIKGTITVSSPEERAKASNFSLHFKGNLDFSQTKSPSFPEVDFINVLAPDVSKKKALEALALHLGIALTEVIAIGDGMNDISLLSSVGLAIAMENAPDEVKAVADCVTLDVDHSGLSAAIQKFLL